MLNVNPYFNSLPHVWESGKNLEVMFRWYFSLSTQEIRKLGELSNLKLHNKAKSYVVQYHNLFSFIRKIRVKFPYFIVVIIELLKK